MNFRRHKDILIHSDDGRQIFLRGVNVPAKLPPFDHGLSDSDCARLREYGLTTVRLGVQWEAIEPEEGKYNNKYIQYIKSTVKLCSNYGISIIIDPHQDCWSRFSGGDGAPRWTMERVGLRPDLFKKTASAYLDVHKDKYNPMLWATNYELFACATMFTLFFGGNRFAPSVKVDKKPVQDWLQSKYIDAIAQLARELKCEANILGFGTMNEPSLGWIGVQDLRNIPVVWRFGYGISPWQSMQLAAGVEMKRVVFYGNLFLPSKLVTLNNQKMRAAWPDPWEVSKVWEWDALDYNKIKLMTPNHFSLSNEEDPVKTFIHPFWDAFAKMIHKEFAPNTPIFTEAPPPQRRMHKRFNPPSNRPSYELNSPHYYDTVAILLQRHISWLAIDLAYEGKFLPIKFGTKGAQQARHNSIELLTKKRGGMMLGEVGTPASAHGGLEATLNAVESNLVNSAILWCYCPAHNGENDGWNREDFSIVSKSMLRTPAAVRPYAQKVAGQATLMQWKDSRFVLEFVENIACKSNETEIFLPELHFPCGAIKATVSDGQWDFDYKTQILTFRHTLTFTSHKITIEKAIL